MLGQTFAKPRQPPGKPALRLGSPRRKAAPAGAEPPTAAADSALPAARCSLPPAAGLRPRNLDVQALLAIFELLQARLRRPAAALLCVCGGGAAAAGDGAMMRGGGVIPYMRCGGLVAQCIPHFPHLQVQDHYPERLDRQAALLLLALASAQWRCCQQCEGGSKPCPTAAPDLALTPGCLASPTLAAAACTSSQPPGCSGACGAWSAPLCSPPPGGRAWLGLGAGAGRGWLGPDWAWLLHARPLPRIMPRSAGRGWGTESITLRSSCRAGARSASSAGRRGAVSCWRACRPRHAGCGWLGRVAFASLGLPLALVPMPPTLAHL